MKLKVSTRSTNNIPRIAKQLSQRRTASVRVVAETVLDRAKQLAPVDSGALRDDLHIEDLGDGSMAVVSNKPYAPIQEYGSGVTGTVASPFLSPASEESRDRLSHELRQGWGK